MFFPHTLHHGYDYVHTHATLRLFWKKHGCDTPTTYTHLYIYLLKHLDEKNGCMDTHELLCVSLMATYIEGSVSLAGGATSIMFVATKHVFCCDKSMLAATKCLSQQNYVCHDKIFLSQQTYLCCDKSFVATSILLS